MIRKSKRVFEQIIEGILFVSSTITSLTVLLIIIFLFREGIELFGSSPIEEGFVLAVNKENPVKEISSAQLKNIFDQNITNWTALGGKNDSIIVFRTDDLSNYY